MLTLAEHGNPVRATGPKRGLKKEGKVGKVWGRVVEAERLRKGVEGEDRNAAVTQEAPVWPKQTSKI